MKKSTKRLISSILTAAMLLTSVTVNPLSAFAADHTADTLEGLTCTTETVDNVKTTTWTFATTEPADKDGVINGNEDLKIVVGDTVEGILITGDEGKAKSWNDGNQFSVSNTMGFSLPITDGCTGGTVTITSTGSNASRYLVLDTDSTAQVPYDKNANSIDFTSANVVDGFLGFNNRQSNGDYKMSQIVLVENLSGESGETSTDTPVETSTETPVETSTETPVETSTSAPVASGEYDYIPVAGVGADQVAFENDQVSIVAMQDLTYAENGGDGATSIGNNTYTSHLVTTSSNTYLAIDGVENGDLKSYRLVFSITAKEDATIVIDSKVSAGKANYILKDLQITGEHSTGNPLGTATLVDVRDNISGAGSVFEAVTVDIAAGETVYFAGQGTNPWIYAIDVVTAGGDTPADTTTTVAEEDSEATTASAETTTTAAEEDSEATTASVETTTVAEEDSETTTTAPVTSGVYDYIPVASVGADQVAFENDEASIVALQDLTYAENGGDGATTIGNNTYASHLVTTSSNTYLAIDGVENGALKSYRLVFSITAKEDATIVIDSKVSSGKANYILKDVQITGEHTTGDPLGTATLVDVRDNISGAGSVFEAVRVDVKAGETIYFAGQGTNPWVYAVDILTANSDGTTETTTSDVEPGTIEIGAKTESDVHVGDTFKVNIDLAGVEGTAGYNNYTFFIVYDPSVVRAVSVATPENIGSYSTVNNTVVYDEGAVNSSINYAPGATNVDYAGLGADGVKTAAELGKIKIANYLGANATKSGTLVALNFEAVGVGESDIKIVKVENGLFPDPGTEEQFTVVPVDTVVSVAEAVSETTTVSESSSETTTESSSESTTETTTLAAGTLGIDITPNSNVSANVGDLITFNVDVSNVENNAGFNNYTFFINYDPDVIEAVEAVTPANPATIDDGTPVYNLEMINDSIGYVPSATNPDFAEAGADGTKTAAQLGRLKLADVIGEDGVTLVTHSGAIASIQFRVKAAGNTNLEIELVENGFNGAVGSELLDVKLYNTPITIVTGDEPGPEPAPGIAGDVNMDGNITGDDCAVIMQKTLDSAYIMKCEEAYPDDYMLIADVNADDSITANDAAMIMQKTLDNSFPFDIDAVRGE